MQIPLQVLKQHQPTADLILVYIVPPSPLMLAKEMVQRYNSEHTPMLHLPTTLLYVFPCQYYRGGLVA